MRRFTITALVGIALVSLIVNAYLLFSIRGDLREVRHLLMQQGQPLLPSPIPQTGTLRLEGGFSLGSVDAPITIVEFTDYQCQFCRQFHGTTFSEIRKKYVDKGAVRFVVRDLPLGIHPQAMEAAEAAHCAGDQGQFWGMHDALLADPIKLGHNDLLGFAKSLKLDTDVFSSCLKTNRHRSEIQNDIEAASSLHLTGTPSFLIGKVRGQDLSGSIVVGAAPLSIFESKFKDN